MTKRNRDTQELQAAAAVNRAREVVVRALGVLAAKPLDEQAAEQMRAALDEAGSAEVKAALRRLRGRGDVAPVLQLLPRSSEPAAARPRCSGGAA